MQQHSILSEISHIEKDKYDISYMEPKIWHKWTYLQNRNRFTHRCVVATVRRVGRGWIGSLGSVDVSYYIYYI